jgi:hypothetical protein
MELGAATDCNEGARQSAALKATVYRKFAVEIMLDSSINFRRHVIVAVGGSGTNKK